MVAVVDGLVEVGAAKIVTAKGRGHQALVVGGAVRVAVVGVVCDELAKLRHGAHLVVEYDCLVVSQTSAREGGTQAGLPLRAMLQVSTSSRTVMRSPRMVNSCGQRSGPRSTAATTKRATS